MGPELGHNFYVLKLSVSICGTPKWRQICFSMTLIRLTGYVNGAEESTRKKLNSLKVYFHRKVSSLQNK